jgi:hypothetical protein
MAQLITIWWRAIPAQVTVRDGRRKASVQLTDRFQIAIDRAAVRAGKETTDEYLAEWHRTVDDCGDDLQVEAEEAAAQLESTYTEAVLADLVSRGGLTGDETVDRQEARS